MYLNGNEFSRTAGKLLLLLLFEISARGSIHQDKWIVVLLEVFSSACKRPSVFW